MKTSNNLQIKTIFNISSNIQFLIHKNYLLSICNEKNRVDFYDMKTFKRKFYLKRKRHEKILIMKNGNYYIQKNINYIL